MDESLPILDPTPLLNLTDHTGDTAAQRFLTKYLEMLPSRVSSVAGCLSSNVEAAKEAVVSLKVTSAMAGAVRMERYCHDLEDTLADRRIPDAAAVLVGMSRTSRLYIRQVRRCRERRGR